MIILGIDTSCDDTSVAVLRDRREILSNVVSSQVPLHRLFGGVVPEIASRKHVELVDVICGEALQQAGVTLQDVDVVAVTQGPGLIGSVLVGLCFAKGLSQASGRPLIGVNHIEAHALSIFLEDQIDFPFLALIVSGGHSVILLFTEPGQFSMIGTTRDDAVGEAFDKIAKYLGLGYPGGKVIEDGAKSGRGDSVPFPRPMIDEKNYDFSFSGLKTAFINYVKKNGISDDNRSDILASFQEAACDILAIKTLRAAKDLGIWHIVLGGGVASNERLREVFFERAEAEGISVHVPPPNLCTDNGAMVAVTGHFYASLNRFSSLDIKGYSRMSWKAC
jgi:N6-L-threonylcarbamoyladenine synthase